MKKEKQAIKYLEEKGYKITLPKLIKIEELNIEIEFKEWTKSYKELLENIPKGFRLMKCSEFFKLAELNLIDKITKEIDINIYLEQLSIDIENKWARVLCRGGDLDLYARNGGLASSDSGGRVIFVRDLK